MGLLDIFRRTEKKNYSILGSGIPAPYSPSNNENKLWVYAAADALACEVGDIEFVMWDRSKDPREQVQSHPLLTLLNIPNPIMTKYYLMNLISKHLSLYGEAYIKIPASGEPLELQPILPVDVSPMVVNGNFTGYTYKGQTLRIDELIRFINPDPDNPIRGKGYLKALEDILSIDKMASQTQIAAFINNAIPSIILSTEQTLKPEDIESLKSMFNEAYRGPQNAGKVVVLEKGLEAKPLSTSLRELELAPLRKQHRDVILSVMKTSGAILGIQEHSNRTAAEANDYTYALRTVKPQMQLIVDALNKWLLPRFPKFENYVLSFKTPVPKDRDFEQKVKIDSLRYRSINELRAEEGYTPVAGGEEIYQQLGNAPLSAFEDYDNAAETISG